MELHSSGGLTNAAVLRARYLARLTRAAGWIPPELKDATIPQLHARLSGRVEQDHDLVAYASIRARLKFARIGTDDTQPIIDDARRGIRFASTPPIRRSTMAPRPWRARHWFSRARRRRAAGQGPASPRPRWYRIAA